MVQENGGLSVYAAAQILSKLASQLVAVKLAFSADIAAHCSNVSMEREAAVDGLNTCAQAAGMV